MTTDLLPDQEILSGVDELIAAYAEIRPDDVVIIAYSPDSREPAAWLVARLRQLGYTPVVVGMRPLVDPGLRDRLREALPAPNDLQARLVIFTLEKETMSHFEPWTEVLYRYEADQCKIFRIISASAEFFTHAVKCTPQDLTQRNASLLNRLGGERQLHITTEGGTDLRATLHPRYDWISNRGVWRPGAFAILPAGEIATYPAEISGTLVADGAVHCNVITRIDMRLANNPLNIKIEDGQAVDFSCRNEDIYELVELCFSRANGRRVGELGFGTNAAIDVFLADNSHINERHPGVHLGFGQHNQSLGQVPYVEEVHLDLITNGAQIRVEGEDELIDLLNLQLTDVPHPNVRDEDITGDCCGFGYNQLRVPMPTTE